MQKYNFFMFSVKNILLFLITAVAFSAGAVVHTPAECQGSLGPYTGATAAAPVVIPDSLEPIFLSHLARHGSRYPAGPYSATTMHRALQRADSLGTITPLGREFAALIDRIIAASQGRWGELDSLGMAEHRGIAERMFNNFPTLFKKQHIVAQATHSPRAIMSMYSFTHRLSQLARDVEIDNTSGHRLDSLLRPFDTDERYRNYMKTKPYINAYNEYVKREGTTLPAKRILGDNYPATDDEFRQLSIIMYYNFANLEAMEMDNDYEPFISLEEYNRLWAIYNLREYFQHTANNFSRVPTEIFIPLLRDIINDADNAIEGRNPHSATLRFAHGETLMPMLCLLGIPGGSFMTQGKQHSNWLEVKEHWKAFEACPMATNLQLLFLRSNTGKVYVTVFHNEQPVSFDPGRYSSQQLIPWEELRKSWLDIINGISIN